jgi:hypothetical protein
MVEENVYKTFTVGVTHFVSPSSPFWDSSKPGICSRRTVRIASGESHDWRVGRSGWEARSFLVFRLYVSIAALKTETKLDWEVDAEGTADMDDSWRRARSITSRRPTSARSAGVKQGAFRAQGCRCALVTVLPFNNVQFPDRTDNFNLNRALDLWILL